MAITTDIKTLELLIKNIEDQIKINNDKDLIELLKTKIRDYKRIIKYIEDGHTCYKCESTDSDVIDIVYPKVRYYIYKRKCKNCGHESTALSYVDTYESVFLPNDYERDYCGEYMKNNGNISFKNILEEDLKLLKDMEVSYGNY